MKIDGQNYIPEVVDFVEEGGELGVKHHDPPNSAILRAPAELRAVHSYDGAAPRMCLVGTENPVRSRPNDAHHSYHAASTRARTGSGTHCAPFLAEPAVRVLVPLGGGRR